jgi:thymidine phosphorylase
VKCGNGAFFSSIDKARAFAELAVSIGDEFNRRVACVISNMNQPLGQSVGNALEAQEAFELLRLENGVDGDLHELCLTLGSALISMTEPGLELDQTKIKLEDVLISGQAWETAHRWITAQGGDLQAFGETLHSLDGYRQIEIRSRKAGYLKALDTLALGELARSLGAGRRWLDDVIDPLVGLRLLAKVGDQVSEGQTVAVIYARPFDPRTDDELAEEAAQTIEVTSDTVAQPAAVLDILW